MDGNEFDGLAVAVVGCVVESGTSHEGVNVPVVAALLQAVVVVRLSDGSKSSQRAGLFGAGPDNGARSRKNAEVHAG